MATQVQPALTSAPINIISLREHARKSLTKILRSMEGEKALVFDRSISGPLGLVAEFDLLKQNGVTAIHHLVPGPIQTQAKNIMYIVRPQLKLMKLIAQQVHELRQADPQTERKYSVQFVPRKTRLCERVLSDEGVLGDLETGEFPLDLVPFDDDVMSLEMSSCFKECFLDGDPTSLFDVARSLIKLESIFGTIPNIKGKGHVALRVFQLLQRMRKEMLLTSAFPARSEIECLFLIDRQVDVISPLLQQRTYEGLVDEFYEIKNCVIYVDPEVVGKESSDDGSGEKKKHKLSLNSNDYLFKEIRDLNFNELGPLLKKKAEYIQTTYDKRHAAHSVSEMHTFMKDFKTAHQDHGLLATHTNLAEQIARITKSKTFDRLLDTERLILLGQNQREVEEYIEELICQQAPFPKVMRLLCLVCQCNGIKQRQFDSFRLLLVQTYGFETLFTLHNLERMLLFFPLKKKSNWPYLRKHFKLFTENLTYDGSRDICLTYDGYAPLSVRLVELASEPGWAKLQDALSALPGQVFEATFTPTPQSKSGERKTSVTASNPAVPPPPTLLTRPGKKPLALVYFLGGVTMAEISALRYLSQNEAHQYEYIVCTTKLINGNTFMTSLMEKVENNFVRKSPSQPTDQGSTSKSSSSGSTSSGGSTGSRGSSRW
eukprot:gb/GEZN01003926.1/.p1 GENE.gb/GEZN01003926.1/~~gb/GEZN01003926.1/.p1  ORF type:complete len:658 (+),score=83.54 gb/GEZN01003926.1/:41-2014(+)